MPAPIVQALSLAALLFVTGASAADPARISVNSPGVIEGGEPGAATLDFTLTRAGDSSTTVTLEYQTDDGTAAAPGDYTALPPTVITLSAGQTQASIPVTINGDSLVEGDESLFLHLTAVLSYATGSFDAGSGAGAVIAADLNADGLPDLAVADALSGDVSVLLDLTPAAAPFPIFAATAGFAAGSTPLALAAADVNGDGLADLIVADYDGNGVSVLLNTTVTGGAMPTFAAATSFAAGLLPASVTAGDFNGDGRADLAVANFGGDSVSVLLNTTEPGAGTASFAAASDFVAGDGPRAVTATDVNGDGLPDLVVANFYSTNVSVLLNTTVPGASTASYADASSFEVNGNPVVSIAATDINGDGRPDLAVATFTNSAVSVLLNTTDPGSGVANFAAASHFGANLNPVSVTATDVDGDGRPDLAAANEGSNDVSVLLNTTATDAGAASFATARSFTVDSIAGSVTAADFNGDGRPDLAVTRRDSDSVMVMLNQLAAIDTSEGTGTILDDDAGSGPDPFSFVDQPGVERDTQITSAAVTMTGIAGPAPISVSGGKYSIGCTGKYTSSGDTVHEGETVCVRQTSSDSYGTATDTTLTVDGVSDTFTSTTREHDSLPDPFAFAGVSDATPGTRQTSSTVTISGLRDPAAIGVSGGEYSIGCTSHFTSDSDTILDGEAVCVRHTSSNAFNTATDTTLTVDSVSGTFTSTTRGPDSQPDPFTFIDVSHALLNTPQISNTVAIRGMHDPAPISVSGGEYSIGCTSAFTSAPGTIADGQTVCVRHTSSGALGVSTDTTLTVGGISDTFTSTTPPADALEAGGSLGLQDVLPGLLLALGLGRRSRRAGTHRRA